MPEAAAIWNKLELLKFFVKNGSKLDGVLGAACARGRNEIVKYLLTIPGIDIEDPIDEDGSSPIMAACHEGNLEIVKMLIERGADINKVDKHGHNSLAVARWSENKELIKYLQNINKGK